MGKSMGILCMDKGRQIAGTSIYAYETKGGGTVNSGYANTYQHLNHLQAKLHIEDYFMVHSISHLLFPQLKCHAWEAMKLHNSPTDTSVKLP